MPVVNALPTGDHRHLTQPRRRASKKASRCGTKVLIVSLKGGGGVEAMRRAVVNELRSRGYGVGLAWYAYYRECPELSVPSWELLFRAPRLANSTCDEMNAHDIGCRLPELEWRHHYPSDLWRQVIDIYDHHICVTGSVLPAWPILATGRACLAWVATPYYADRASRLPTYSRLRRITDSLLDAPVCTRLERSLLARANILALSTYTHRALEAISPGSVKQILPMPVAGVHLAEPVLESRARGPWRVGFAARYEDPRKNLGLLIEALSLCRARGLEIELTLVGGNTNAALVALAKRHGMSNHITFGPILAGRPLARFYRSIDLFVIPSHQEGLAIVGLEAMAAGCSVISTRCGGPEDYVIDGENGRLVGFDAAEMADAVAEILLDPAKHRRLRAAARATALSRYTETRFQEGFWKAFGDTFGTI